MLSQAQYRYRYALRLLSLTALLLPFFFYPGCGPGIVGPPSAQFAGFPNYGTYRTQTGFIRGRVRVYSTSSPSIQVSIDGDTAVTATLTGSVDDFTWQVRLPQRLANPRSWNFGSTHTAKVSVYDDKGKLLLEKTGTFQRGTLRDANDDGFVDLVVGAGNSDVTSADGGAAYYYGSNNGSYTSNSTQITNPTAEAGAQFGRRSAFVGDLNGDGYADAAFTVHLSDLAGPNRGGLYVAYGSSSGLQNQSLVRVNCSGCANSTRMGFGLAIGADVNADGYDDLVTGGGADRLYVFFGSASGVSTSQDQTISYPAGDTGTFFGQRVMALPDVNGDAYPDVFIGASLSDAAGAVDAGAGYLYLGSATGLASSPTTTFFPNPAIVSDSFGVVTQLGDVSGDGIFDLFLSSTSHNSNSGFGNLYLGTSSGIPNTASFTLSHPTGKLGTLFGGSTAMLSDIDGDSQSDFAMAASGLDTDTDYSGEILLYSASRDGSAPQWLRSLSYPHGDFGARFGAPCSQDVNGDGIIDLVTAAHFSDLVTTDGGAVFIFLGTENGFSATPDYTLGGSESGASFGNAVCAGI